METVTNGYADSRTEEEVQEDYKIEVELTTSDPVEEQELEVTVFPGGTCTTCEG